MLAARSARACGFHSVRASSPVSSKNFGAEAAVPLASGIEIRLIDRAIVDDGGEDIAVARLAGGGEPLHAMLVGAALKSEQFRDAPVEFADRIRIEDFFFEHEPVSFGAPTGAAAQVAFAVQRNHDCVRERAR